MPHQSAFRTLDSVLYRALVCYVSDPVALKAYLSRALERIVVALAAKNALRSRPRIRTFPRPMSELQTMLALKGGVLLGEVAGILVQKT